MYTYCAALMVLLVAMEIHHIRSYEAPMGDVPGGPVGGAMGFADPDNQEYYSIPKDPCSTMCDHCPPETVEELPWTYYHPFTGEPQHFVRLQCPIDCELPTSEAPTCTGEGNYKTCTCPPNDNCWRDTECARCAPQFVTVFFDDIYCCEDCLPASIQLTGTPWSTSCACMHPRFVNSDDDEMTDGDGGDGNILLNDLDNDIGDSSTRNSDNAKMVTQETDTETSVLDTTAEESSTESTVTASETSETSVVDETRNV